MLRRRIIPFLQIDKNFDCVKTIRFKDRQYIGDIFNNIRIFNEKKADEMVVLDIDASKHGKDPKFELIKKIASVCRMPLTYGGGVKNLTIAKEIIKYGVEKISINTSALKNISLLTDISQEIGSQSLSVCLNLKRIDDDYRIVYNSKELAPIQLIDYLHEIQNSGIGEIILSSVDNDGIMNGFDLNILDKYLKYIQTPSILLGGCSGNENIKYLFNNYKNVAAGCSSIFIFKGKLKAVLINYPSESDREKLFLN